MARQPKVMTSKFDGTCSACQRHVNAGETIRWLARGTIECSDCMGVSDAPAQPQQQPNQPAKSDAWRAAMTWDDDTPQPGASLTTVTKPSAPPKPDNVTQLRDVSAPEPVTAPMTDTNEPSDVVPILSDLLVLLVNALDNATPGERQQVFAQAIQMAETASTPSRKHYWRQLSETVGA